jgi:hypothetical protein
MPAFLMNVLKQQNPFSIGFAEASPGDWPFFDFKKPCLRNKNLQAKLFFYAIL